MPFSASKGYVVKPKPGVQINPAHPLSQGLVGCWLLNEGTGSRVNDISGSGNHGILTGMSPGVWHGSKYGGGLQFDGSDDRVIAGVNDVPVDELSYATIVRGMSGGADSSYTTGGSSNSFYMFITRALGKIEMYLHDGSWHAYNSTNLLSLDGQTWYHLMVTWRKSTGKVRIYINGVLDSEHSGITNSLSVPTAMYLGGQNTQNNFYGNIDSSWVWDRTLLQAEVEQHNHNPFSNLLRAPIHYVPAAAGGLPIPVAMYNYRKRRVA